MNKKLLLGAALLVGMGTTFTSCVDSTESESVTNIREAKAAQLKSIADYNNALAEKERILANANKATQEAQQELAKAQAEYLKAQAEHEKAQADLLKAQAALLDAQTEAEKQKLAYELQLLQAELDAKAQELAEAQAALANAQALFDIELQKAQEQLAQIKIQTQKLQFIFDQMVKKAMKEEDQAKKDEALAAAARVKELIGWVDFYSQQLVSAQTKLAKDQLELARVESSLENAKQTLKDKIAELKDDNVYLNAEINYFKDLLSNIEGYAGKTVEFTDCLDALDSYCKADLKKEDADNAYSEAGKVLYGDAQTGEVGAYDVLRSSDYVKLARQIINDNGSYYTYNEQMEENDWYHYEIQYIGENQKTISPSYYDYLNSHDYAINVPSECRGKYTLLVTHYNIGEQVSTGNKQDAWEYTFTPVFEPIEYDYLPVVEGQDQPTYRAYSTYYNLVNDGAGVQAWLKCRLEVLNNAKPTTVKDLQTLLDEAIKAQTAATKALENAAKNLAQKKAADQEAQKKVTEAGEDAGKKLQALNAANEVANKPDATDAQKQAAADAQTAYDAAVTALNAARQAAQAAQEASGVAFGAQEDAKSDLKYANAVVTVLQNDLANANENVSDNAAQVAAATEMVDKIIAESATNDANIEAYNQASKTYKETELAYNDASAEASAAQTLYNDLYFAWRYHQLYGGNPEANFWAQVISLVIEEDYEAIEDNLNEIKEKEAALAKLNTAEAQNEYNQYYEELKLDLQEKIAKDNSAIAAAKQLYDIAVAELEAALEEQK